MKVLLSAFSCLPGKGSEPGIGWNLAQQMAEKHKVWVLTQSKNRQAIEAEQARNPTETLQFLYFDLPLISRLVKEDGRLQQTYYYFWHLCIYFIAFQYHRKIHFDLANHVTWGRYWMPNMISLLPIPFVWGPIGGGESTPQAFLENLGLKGKQNETLRIWVRRLGEYDPFVRVTARKTTIALATNRATATRHKILGTKRVECFPSQPGINQQEFNRLSTMTYPTDSPTRFISMGRLLPWKGNHLSLHAFALSKLTDAEFWIVGDGPDKERLASLANILGIAKRVKFFGFLPRTKVWDRLEQCHVLLHPCLRELTTTACIEAMAARRPIIALDLGQGNNTIPTEESGFRILACSPDQVAKDMAEKMVELANNSSLRMGMGKAAFEQIAEHYLWKQKANLLNYFYSQAIESGNN